MSQSETEIVGYVAGKWRQGQFVPFAIFLKIGERYKVKSPYINLYVDNYGHITLKWNKFFKDQQPKKEGETADIKNLIKEFLDAGFYVIEFHESKPVTRDINISSSIVPTSGFNFPATI